MSNILFPAWFRGPGGQKAIFHRAEDVPPGWYSGHENRHLIREEDDPPPADGADAWGGIPKPELVQMLRNAGEKIHAATSARKLHEKATELGLIGVADKEPAPPTDGGEPAAEKAPGDEDGLG